MINTVTDVDRGYAAFARLMEEVDGVAITAGVQQEEGASRPPGSRATVAEYATYNEFGTETIPERPAFRGTADNRRDEWARALYREVGGSIDRLGTVGLPRVAADIKRGLNRVGLRMARDIQNGIRDLRTPPNAASTIREKGSSNPLIDTGRLRASIRHKVEGL